MPRLIPYSVAFLALAAALTLAAACADSTDDATGPPAPSGTPAATPTPTQPPDAAGGGAGEATVLPVTPLPSPSPVPADWNTYADPDGRFILSYPDKWFLRDGATSQVRPPGHLTTILSTFDVGTLGPQFPPNSMKVDVVVWSNSPDPGSNCESTPEGALPTSFGGVPGWQRVVTYDPPAQDVTQSHAVVALRDGYCFSLTAYFTEGSPHEATFQQMISSFQFTR
jgi:hypothetical protein